MSKQLYEEALADVKRVKQVAEDNATRAVLAAVTPRIRDFIDSALLNEYADEEMDDPMGDARSGLPTPPSAPSMLGGDAEDAAVTDIVAVDPTARVPADVGGVAAAITPPDAEGKVTLDIDALCSAEPGAPVPPPMFGEPAMGAGEEEYEISLESISALQPVLGTAKAAPGGIKARINKINERVRLLKGASKAVRSTTAFNEQLARMIVLVEDMYDHVQERVTDPAVKVSYETALEASFKDLNRIQESMTMSKATKQGLMNEEDVTLKLTGLPDDIDLDSVGVDLITGEEDGEGDQGDQGDDAGLDDLDMGGEGQPGQEGEEQQMETRRLSDDTIVEIDEKMLRREIARMRSLREEHSADGGSETKAQSWGNGSGGSNILDDFGGGADEGEPTDAEIVDKSSAPGALPLGEADGDLDEQQDQMDEQDDDDLDEQDQMDELDQIGDKRTRDDFGGSATSVPSVDKDNPAQRRAEGLRRLGFEKKLQERAKSRARALKKEASLARSKKNAKRYNEAKKEYAVVAQRFNESVKRAQKMTQIVARATKQLQESRLNSAAAQPAGNQAENATLRKKLAETNLFNAKLLYTNKLLQNEQLTSRQKAQVIKQLDEVKTVREAKLVYESLANTLAGSSKPVNENRDRQVLGSSSRATRPASTQTLNEGYEAERWAQLAGITKR